MQPKIYWIDNLRGIACLMVVMIHTTTWYVTNAHSVSPVTWDIANVLNSASRVSVPLFFMISGYLFFGERSAQPRHFLRKVGGQAVLGRQGNGPTPWLTERHGYDPT